MSGHDSGMTGHDGPEYPVDAETTRSSSRIAQWAAPILDGHIKRLNRTLMDRVHSLPGYSVAHEHLGIAHLDQIVFGRLAD